MIFNSLVLCLDFNLGIRSLLKSKNKKKSCKLKLVENMPIERHIKLILQYILSLSIDELNNMDDRLLVLLLKVFLLLNNNELGKNIIYGLRKDLIKNNIYSYVKSSSSYSILVEFMRFIENYLSDIKESINLKSLLLVLKIETNDDSYKLLIENMNGLLEKVRGMEENC